jgi:hypothetical protein
MTKGILVISHWCLVIAHFPEPIVLTWSVYEFDRDHGSRTIATQPGPTEVIVADRS